jgi:hypothetical protein
MRRVKFQVSGGKVQVKCTKYACPIYIYDDPPRVSAAQSTYDMDSFFTKFSSSTSDSVEISNKGVLDFTYIFQFIQ